MLQSCLTKQLFTKENFLWKQGQILQSREWSDFEKSRLHVFKCNHIARRGSSSICLVSVRNLALDMHFFQKKIQLFFLIFPGFFFFRFFFRFFPVFSYFFNIFLIFSTILKIFFKFWKINLFLLFNLFSLLYLREHRTYV